VCNKGITQFYLPPTHEPYLPLLPSRKASPPFGRYQLILLGEQRHIGVRKLPRVFTPHAWPRVEPTTSWSQVRHSINSVTTPPGAWAPGVLSRALMWAQTVCGSNLPSHPYKPCAQSVRHCHWTGEESASCSVMQCHHRFMSSKTA